MDIPQFEPWLGEDEKRLVSGRIDANWITGGPKVKEFESKIALLCQSKHAISCCNGTLALYIALKAIGLPQGAEVIVPDFTFIASANAVVMAGGVPVFADIDRETLNIDVNEVITKITKNTFAIMPVHIYGRPANMALIIECGIRRNLAVVEDAAQGIGVSYDGHPVGAIGDVGILSFYADKTMTTGEGGMVLTNDDFYAELATRLCHQGNTSKGKYIHDTIGFNFRLTDLQAAVGLAQLERLPDIIASKKRIEALYHELLSSVPGVRFINDQVDTVTVPFRIVIFVENPEQLSLYLQSHGIGSNRVFYPLHLQPCYQGYEHKGDFPNSVWAYEHGLALPSSAKLTDEQVEYVCEHVATFLIHNHMRTKVQ